MTKKILSSAAVAALISTSAMAYENSELAKMTAGPSKAGSAIASTTQAGLAGAPGSGSTNILTPTTATTSNSLLFPAFFSSTGWESTIRVINTDDSHAVVAKVVFYDGKDSHELRDFNIYLSANDEWTGTVKIVDGKATVISTDDSAPVEATVARGAYPMATEADPMTAVLGANSGYIEVIGMVAGEADLTANGPFDNSLHSGLTAAYHKKHSLLREDYTNFSMDVRGTTAASIFKDGVVQQGANFPYVSITDAGSTFDALGNLAPLAGDIRITNTANGTDMDMPAINLNYDTTAGKALVYLEGEKANIADVEIDTAAKTYDLSSVTADLDNLTPTAAYITYGDAAINNNYALFTSPFKRTIAQLTTPVLAADNLNTVVSKYFNDADLRDTTAPNFGSFSLTASIYDMSENTMSAGQFSPATTPTLVFKNELDSTGTDVADANKLPFYLEQAAANGFNKGYVILKNVDTTAKIPAIVTQMMATTAGSTTVTNWIRPTTK